MASIHLLGGKKKLLTIQVIDLVHLQSLVQCARLLKKHVKSVLAVLTSLGLVVFLISQFHDTHRLNKGRYAPDDAGQTQRMLHGIGLPDV